MSLIQAERDTEEVLRAEDEAIAAAARGEQEVSVPVGDELATLIERLSNADYLDRRTEE